MYRQTARVSFCTLLAIVGLYTAMAFGQAVTGTILGRVTDNSGAVLVGATVQLQNLDNGATRSEQTDAGGRYQARNLSPGTYTITVQQPGFRTEVRSGIVVTVASEQS